MKHDNTSSPVVITLDAGGTNFVFGAMRDGVAIGESLTLPSSAHDLDLCLGTLIRGFEQIIASLDTKPAAISFAFPGPADYRNGIIGGYLPNFPSFRDGVALGPMLEEHFGIPVYFVLSPSSALTKYVPFGALKVATPSLFVLTVVNSSNLLLYTLIVVSALAVPFSSFNDTE